MSKYPYTIVIATDNPFIFDMLDEAGGNWEANMTQHRLDTSEVVDGWSKRSNLPRSALADPDNVQMEVVEQPRFPAPGVYNEEQGVRTERPPDWEHENPDET